MRKSTRTLWRIGRKTERYSVMDFVHGYVYARWPYAYIGWAKGDRKVPALLRPLIAGVGKLLFRSGGDPAASRQAFAERYHGKVVPPTLAEQLVTLDRPIELRGLEHVIPFATARDLILSDPDHIAVLECPCRAGVENPCLPLDVCMIIGEPFVQFILEHHPDRARRISQDEAVEILRAEHERGHVHHAFFKDAMLGRFYAICNCCSCCCGAMQAHRNGTPMLISSGFLAALNDEACVGCGRCVDICPFDAISIVNDTATVDEVGCMGCGVCVTACSQGALALRRAPEKGAPLDLSALLTDR